MHDYGYDRQVVAASQLPHAPHSSSTDPKRPL
jgi:hypothetical protein